MVREVPRAGAARPLWPIEANWQPNVASRSRNDGTFGVAMDGVRVQWTWDPGARRFLRSQDGAAHLVEGGAQVAADNVVEVPTVYVSSIVDARSPHAVSLGSGAAVVHRDGRATDAMWSRMSPHDSSTFRDAVTGSVIPLDVGTTFIELVRAS